MDGEFIISFNASQTFYEGLYSRDSSPQRNLCTDFFGFFGNDRDDSEPKSSSKQVGDGESCAGDSMFLISSAIGILER